MKEDYSISKTLSANDTGETGSHQVGFCIPKKQEILEFFPTLSAEEKNPRRALQFRDEFGRSWSFQFIYYNNKFFGGTRNEYRLTGVTGYVRTTGLRAGDRITLTRTIDSELTIAHSKEEDSAPEEENGKIKLKLGSGWKVVSL
tara:strand:- start:3830 stop:4261 length:432 start_codon:yes stop_codon:yes gene_type:complete